MQKILQIQDKLSGKNVRLLEPHRRFKKEGEFRWYIKAATSAESPQSLAKTHSQRDVKTTQKDAIKGKAVEELVIQLSYFLFNDSLVLACEDTGLLRDRSRLVVKANAPLPRVELVDVGEGSGRQNVLEIIVLEPEKKTYVVATATSKEKEDWIKDFYYLRSKVNSFTPNLDPKIAAEINSMREEKQKKKKDKQEKKMEKEKAKMQEKKEKELNKDREKLEKEKQQLEKEKQQLQQQKDKDKENKEKKDKKEKKKTSDSQQPLLAKNNSKPNNKKNSLLVASDDRSSDTWSLFMITPSMTDQSMESSDHQPSRR